MWSCLRVGLLWCGLVALGLQGTACFRIPSCEERVQNSLEMIETVRKTGLSCTADEDCTSIITMTKCQGACPQAVNTEKVDNVKKIMGEADRKWCDNYRASGCGYLTPKCQVLEPKCEAGTCTLVEP